MAREIPIQNLYYLLCYAWDQLEEGELIDVASDDPKSLAEWFARILAHGTRHLVRRGFDRGYTPHTEESSRLRGRLAISPSLRRQSWLRGRMVCEFDEFSHNILHNRILKTTIDEVLGAEGIEKETCDLLREQAALLSHVDPVPISGRIFRRVRLHRNNRFYRFILNVCELIHESKLPEQRDGTTRFRDFLRDPQKMPGLFEKFVRNFYAREQNRFRVGRISLRWDATGAPEDLVVLPKMQTDVSLHSPGRTIILDCKFYKEAMNEWFGKERTRSQHLYQIYAYIRNAETLPGWEGSEGILLYPAVGRQFDHCFEIAGHPVRVATVDLSLPWKAIHERLLLLLEPGGVEKGIE